MVSGNVLHNIFNCDKLFVLLFLVICKSYDYSNFELNDYALPRRLRLLINNIKKKSYHRISLLVTYFRHHPEGYQNVHVYLKLLVFNECICISLKLL